jgi:acetyl esterase/lipase
MEIIPSLKLTYGDQPSQFGVLRLPNASGKCPVVVTIHGGFWKAKYGLEEISPLDEDLTKRGYATWNIEYRRVGEPGGGWKGTFHDVVDSVNFLSQLEKDFPLDLSRVVVIGHSAGGHLALWLASRANNPNQDKMDGLLQIPIKGVISLAGISDLQRMWEIDAQNGIVSPVANLMGGTPKEYPDRYHFASPIDQLPVRIPQILIHGDLDEDVPAELSLKYYQRAIDLNDQVDLKILAKTDHFILIDPISTAWQSAIDSLNKLVY